ncbi:MAG: MCP four helix bundle domain-containing protein [Hydrogenophaga sp.]|nr:MCP four helix bundle domain-containing protein [Hydrogenophaga sp.]
MSLLSRLRIGSRLALAFASVIVLSVIVVVIGITRMSTITESLVLIGADRVPKLERVDAIADDVNLIARELRNTLIFEEQAQIEGAIAEVIKARTEIGKTLEQLTPTINSDEGRALLAAVVAARNVFVPLQQEMIDHVRAGRRDPAAVVLTERLRPAQLNYMEALDKLKAFQIGLIDRAVAEGERSYQAARTLMFSLLAAMAALSAWMGWLITRSITRPIGEAVTLAQKVAEGDLTGRIDTTASDETGQLLTALKTMNQNLARIVQTVRQGSDSIATGSAQIAMGNADLSQRTEEQASALEETAASMEQLGSTVNQNADNARQANQLAQSASEVAGRGGEVVGQVVTTMQDIQASSQKIADIIGVIDGIAFQTNILALNAAVEAARAGEQGRGFAVVAGEVRNLAQRSAEAAKEIKTLIGASVDKVQAGTQLVAQAGSTMQDVVSSVRRVTDIMGEISSASAEQSASVTQVGGAVTQMDQVTQQNAALVEESAAAADSLKKQAEQLVQAVAVFKIEHGTVVATAAPLAPVARAPRTLPAPAKATPRAAAPLAAPKAPKALPAAAPATADDNGEWTSF